MNLLLHNFETIIESRFVDRRLDYWLNGAVISLEKVKNNVCKSKVEGSIIYHARIKLQDEKVVSWNCDCPFDGTVCKHITAMLFVIKYRLKETGKILEQSEISETETDFDWNQALIQAKAHWISQKKFENLIHKAVDYAYDTFEYFDDLNDEIKNLSKEEIQNNIKKIEDTKRQITPLLDIFEKNEYESKSMDRLEHFLSIVEEDLPKIKRKLKKQMNDITNK